MKPLLFFFFSVILVAVAGMASHQSSVAKRTPPNFEMRCGWFENPTPSNMWFYDRDGEWTIGVQGAYQVPKEWAWPTFKSGQWVRRNGEYGYGCACFRMRVNKKTFEVLEIQTARARRLAVCRRDQSLKKWRSRFN